MPYYREIRLEFYELILIECSEILNRLYTAGIFENWLIKIIQSKEIEKELLQKPGAVPLVKKFQEISKWRIGLLSISLKGSERNTKAFSTNPEIKQNIIELFADTPPIDETYVFLLRIIQYTSEKDEKTATEYMVEKIDEQFKYKIRDKLIIYKKFDALTENEEEENNKTDEERQLEFRILAAQID